MSVLFSFSHPRRDSFESESRDAGHQNDDDADDPGSSLIPIAAVVIMIMMLAII